MANDQQVEFIHHTSDWWTLEIPRTWKSTEESKCAAFRANPPIGVLQVSAVRKPQDSVTFDDVHEFAFDSKTRKAAIRPFSTSRASGLYAEYQESGLHWREWWLSGGSVLVLLTYNVSRACPARS